MMTGEKKKCPDCGDPQDMHVRPGVMGPHDGGGCKMMIRPVKIDLRLVPCTCPRTPETFLAVAR